MTSEEADKRCNGCKYCDKAAYYDGCMYMGCKKMDNKWVAKVDSCPMEELKGSDSI
jgi:hypothetical protein